MTPRISPCGDSALSIDFAETASKGISPEINDCVHALSASLSDDPISGIRETVPSYSSLLVYFDPDYISFTRLAFKLDKRIKKADTLTAVNHMVIPIPVCYGGEFGSDIETVAAHTGLSEEEIIARHTKPFYRIYMIGFLPGFPYLGGLDTALETPRLKTPRTLVPAGSVGIAANQTGIYPLASPGGWQLIGRTPVNVYDPHRAEPVPYKAGDYIRFYAVDFAEYHALVREVEVGAYVFKKELLSQSDLK